MNLSLKFLLPAVDRALGHMKTECALRTCPNNHLIRCLPQSKVGIRVGERWYCSVDCFAIAAGNSVSALSSRRVVEIPRNPRLSLGLAMLSKGYLTAEQLRSATIQAQWSGEELEAALVRRGLASEKQLAAARAAQWGYPVLAQDHVGQLVEADIPRVFLHACSAVPLHYSVTAKRILLGFVYRVEHTLLESIEQTIGFRAEPCFITSTEFEEKMKQLTAVPNHEEVVVDDPGTPEQMGRTVGQFAVEVAAREASFTQCKGHVWARLSGRRGKIDVIFRSKSAAEAAKNRESTVLEESIASLG